MHKDIFVFSGIFVAALASLTLSHGADFVPPPKVVGIPPADAGRGLVRVSDSEIRHYSGVKSASEYAVSVDNGLTWSLRTAPASYPPNYGGMPKESPDVVRNPLTKEFIRVQPINGFVFLSKGGIDGKWMAVTRDGGLESEWKDQEKRKNLLTLDGIMRSPTFVNKGKRILIPSHSGAGTRFHISDDGGLTWTKSRGVLTSPRHQALPPHEGVRWFNNAAETSVVELLDGMLYALSRTSMDQHYESFSKDFGDTWTPAKPSRFFGTLTMPTVGKLADGTLVALWTNTMALPENRTAGEGNGEDVFTNRDSHHIALSRDKGKSWFGFRELILDEKRNAGNYATLDGAEDRGKHQSQFVQLDNNRILVSLGQHPSHRKLMIVDLRWVEEKKRATHAGEQVNDWTVHTYIPQVAGHCSYNRKPGSTVVSDAGDRKVLQIKRLDDDSLVNEKSNVDYRNGGATWNFPNGTVGKLEFTFKIPSGEQAEDSGLQISLMDRLFNACDATAKDYAFFTFPLRLRPHPYLDVEDRKISVMPGKWNTISLIWKDGLTFVSLNGKPAGKLNAANISPNGVSYIHFISTGTKPDTGVLIDSVEVEVK